MPTEKDIEQYKIGYKQPTRTFGDIEAEAQRLKTNYEERVNTEVLEEIRQDDLGKGLDDMRYANKKMLNNFAADHNSRVKNAEVKQLLLDLSEYAITDVTATFTSLKQLQDADEDIEFQKNKTEYYKDVKDQLKQESELFEKLYKNSKKLYAEFDKQLKDASEETMGKEAYEDLLENIRVTSNLLMYFEGQRDGHLEPAPKNAHIVNAVGRNIKLMDAKRDFNVVNSNIENKNIPAKDVPLFTHDPSPNDLKQGGMGDCYLLTGLSQLAARHPEKIKEMIRENDDNTVTVRFFARKYDEKRGPGAADSFEPVYVTIDKMVMSDDRLNGASNNMWAQMIERAYLASGLIDNVGNYESRKAAGDITNANYAVYTKPVPENIDELYEKYSKLPPTQWPSHEECPWLVDLDGNLHKYELDMKNLQGNLAGVFLESVLGEEYENQVLKPNQEEPGTYDFIEEYAIEAMRQAAAEKGGNLSEEQIRSTRQEIKRAAAKGVFDGIDAASKVVYTALTGKQPKLNDDGSYITSKDVIIDEGGDFTQYAVHYMVSDLFFVVNQRLNIDKGSEHGVNYKEIKNKLKSAYEKGAKTYAKDDDRARQQRRDILAEDKELNNKLLNLAEASGKKVCLNTFGRVGLETQYTEKQERMYADIAQTIHDGGLVTAGSKKSANKDSGLIPGHAYSVQRVFSENVNGNEIKYVELRNPHGYNGMKYVEDDNFGMEMVPDRTAEGGVFKVELADFFRTFDNVGLNLTKKQEDAAKVKGSFDAQSADEYGKMLHNMRMAIKESNSKRPDKLIPEKVAEFDSALRKFRHEIANDVGINVSQITTLNSYTDLMSKTQALLEYCNTNKAALSPQDVSAFQVAKSVENLSTIIRKNERLPLSAANKQIASDMVDKLGEMMLQSKDAAVKARWEKLLANPNVKDGVIQEIQASSAYKKAFGKKSFVELSNLSEKERAKVMSKFVKDKALNKYIDDMISLQADVPVAPEIPNVPINDVAPNISVSGQDGDIQLENVAGQNEGNQVEADNKDALLRSYEEKLSAIKNNDALSPEERKMQTAIAESGYELAMLAESLESVEGSTGGFEKAAVLKPSLCKYLARVALNRYMLENPESAKAYTDEKNIESMAKELAASGSVDSLLAGMLEKKDSFKNINPDELYDFYVRDQGKQIQQDLEENNMAAHEKYNETWTLGKQYGKAVLDSKSLIAKGTWGLTPTICNQVKTMTKDLKALSLSRNSLQSIAFSIMVGEKKIPVEDAMKPTKEMQELRTQCAKEAVKLVVGNKSSDVAKHLMNGMKALNAYMLPHGNELKEFTPEELLQPKFSNVIKAGAMLKDVFQEAEVAIKACKKANTPLPFKKEEYNKESALNDSLNSTFKIPINGAQNYLKNVEACMKDPTITDEQFYNNVMGEYMRSAVYSAALKSFAQLPENKGKNPVTLADENFAVVCAEVYTNLAESQEFKDFGKFVLKNSSTAEKMYYTISNGSFLKSLDLKVNLNTKTDPISSSYSASFDELKQTIKNEVTVDPLSKGKSMTNEVQAPEKTNTIEKGVL